MRRVPKLTPRVEKQIKELMESRNSIDQYFANFLLNVSKYGFYIHYVYEFISNTLSDMDEEAYFFSQIPISQYLISLVSCWETFFRDIFIFLAKNSEDFQTEIMNLVDIKVDVSDEDFLLNYLSKAYNFQNLKDIDKAFSKAFKGIPLEEIGDFVIPIVKTKDHMVRDFSLNKWAPGWFDYLNNSFEQRHKIIHDANYVPDITIKFIQRAEICFFIIPQLFTIWIAKEYNFKHYMIEVSLGDIKIDVPYIFNIEDVIVGDWIMGCKS